MRKQWCKLILLFFSMLLLSGCWDRQELNDIAIVVGMGIDKQEDQIKLSVQIVNPGSVSSQRNAGSQGAPVLTYTETGKTIMEVIRKLTTISPRKLYLSHLRVVIIGEEAAREGIAPLLDFLARDHEVRTDFYLIVSHGHSAEDVLDVATLVDKIPSNKMFDSLETSEGRWAATGKITIDEVIHDIASVGEEAVLTGIVVKGDIKQGSSYENLNRIALRTMLQFDGMAMFKDDRLIGWLTIEQSKAYNYIKGHVRSTLAVVPCMDMQGEIGLEVRRSSSKIKGAIRNNKPSIHISLDITANIAEVMCPLDLSNPNVIRQLEQQTEELMQTHLTGAIQQIQTVGSDIFGFGEAIHRSNPTYWSSHKTEWDRLFKELEVKVQVDVQIKNIGSYTRYIHMKEE